MPRVQVIRALADTRVALTAYMVHDIIIKGGGKIDVVSVYRILDTLQEIKLIHHVGIANGYFPRLQFDDEAQGTQVVYCLKCNQIDELALAPDTGDAIAKHCEANGYPLSSFKIEAAAAHCPRCPKSKK